MRIYNLNNYIEAYKIYNHIRILHISVVLTVQRHLNT